ncbi:hypothetical protein Hdeb2414_s0012g00388441 [Helianthus debilis subsp. tardiflorus]
MRRENRRMRERGGCFFGHRLSGGIEGRAAAELDEMKHRWWMSPVLRWVYSGDQFHSGGALFFFPTKLYVSAQFRVIHSQNDRVGCRLRSFGLDGQSQSTGQRLRVRLNRFRLTRSS